MIKNGFSLVEIMVVIVAFALMSVLVSQVIILSLKGTTKSESLGRVRGEINHAVSTMTKNLRNAELLDIDPDVSTCFNPDNLELRKKVVFTDSDGVPDNYYECDDDFIVDQNGDHLTGEKTEITICIITCVSGEGGVPDSITLELEAKDKEISGSQAGVVSINTKILLRNY